MSQKTYLSLKRVFLTQCKNSKTYEKELLSVTLPLVDFLVDYQVHFSKQNTGFSD